MNLRNLYTLKLKLDIKPQLYLQLAADVKCHHMYYEAAYNSLPFTQDADTCSLLCAVASYIAIAVVLHKWVTINPHAGKQM